MRPISQCLAVEFRHVSQRAERTVSAAAGLPARLDAKRLSNPPGAEHGQVTGLEPEAEKENGWRCFLVQTAHMHP